MTVPPSLLVHTRDPELLRRIEGALPDRRDLHATGARAELERLLEHGGPALLLFDLRTSEARDLLPDLLRHHPDLLIIALGERRSDPALLAESLGAYAVEDVEVDRRRLHSLVGRALDHVTLQAENVQLRENAARGARETRPGARPERERGEAPLSLRHFSRALRHFDNVDAMVDRIVEGLASTAMVSRAGIFGCIRNSGSYRLLAGLNCLDDARRLTFAESDVFVRWLERHTPPGGTRQPGPDSGRLGTRTAEEDAGRDGGGDHRPPAGPRPHLRLVLRGPPRHRPALRIRGPGGPLQRRRPHLDRP
jgi:hypothetical protein